MKVGEPTLYWDAMIKNFHKQLGGQIFT
jgi:hypothetical protein